MTRNAISLACASLIAWPSSASAQQSPIAAPPSQHHIEVGALAPDFTLLDANWKPVRLSDYRGKKNVILVFHVVAYSPHCAMELRAYQRAIALRRDHAPVVVLGINMDSPYGNEAFAKQLGVTIPILSDMRTTVLRDYGVAMRESKVGTYTYVWPEHTTVLIDRAGIVRYVEAGDAAMDPTHVFDAVRRTTSSSSATAAPSTL